MVSTATARRREPQHDSCVIIAFGGVQIAIKGKRAMRWLGAALMAILSHVGYTEYRVWSLQAEIADCRKIESKAVKQVNSKKDGEIMAPNALGKGDVVTNSIGVGFKLLPFFVRGVETLFGKKTGETKKQAVLELVDAATLGTAAGFGLAGDPEIAAGINVFRPAFHSAIDELASAFFPPDPPAA